MTRRLSCFLYTVMCISSLFVVSATAQVTSLDNTTSPPVPGVGHDYIKMFGETVNPANGSLTLRIDLPTPKGRGLDIPFSILYSSSGVEHVMGNTNGGGAWATDTGQQSGSGWTYSIPTLTTIQVASGDYHPGPPPVTYTCYYYNSYIMRDWTGAAHPLGAMTAAQNPHDGSTGCDQSNKQPGSNLTGSDGVFQGTTTVPTSPLQPNPVTVAGPDGTVYQFSPAANILNANNVVSFWAMASSMEDRNGNFAQTSFVNGANGTSGAITDTVGRTLVNVSGVVSNSNSVSVSGQTGSYTQTWSSVPVNFNVTSTPTGSIPCTGIGIAPSQSTNYVVKTLTLPNGKSYKFQYDSTYGLLNKITYPSGGYVSYTWGLNPQSEIIVLPAPPNFSVSTCDTIYDTPAILWRNVSYDGVNLAEQQSFTYQTTWNGSPNFTLAGKQTTVTTYDLVRNSSYQTVYKYAPYVPLVAGPLQSVPLEQTITYNDVNGSALKTVTKAWINQLLLGCEIETLDNGSNSGEWYFYGSGNQLTDKKEYDYGLIGSASACQQVISPPGVVSSPPSGVTPTRETLTSYQNLLNTPIFPSGPSIFDRPSTVKTYGGGTLMAETDYAYDGTSVSSVSAYLHDGTNYGTSYNNRGNVTTKTVKCLQTGCPNTVTTYSYDETGQVLSRTDPCGSGTCSDMISGSHVTNFSYTDAYTTLSGGQNVSYTPPNGSTNAYLTKITDPLGHTSTFTYDYSNGELTALKDQNDITAGRSGTTYIYNDVFARPTQVNRPDGGQTEYYYNDSPPSPTVATCELINGTAGATCSPTTPPSGWKTSVAVMDGLGHNVQTQLPSDPDGTDYVDISYDGIGKVKTRSNPHRTSSATTDGTTSFTYDALGRPTEVDQPDGSNINTSYSGNAITVTDETGRLRKSYSDAFGRLNEVDEPGGSNTLATAGSATVTIGGSEQTIPAASGSAYIPVNSGNVQCISNGYGGYYPDSGSISVTVYGVQTSTGTSSWGGSCSGQSETLSPTFSTIISNLAGSINGTSAGVSVTSSGSGITITALATGTGSNYPLSNSYTATGNAMYATTPSALSGGRGGVSDSGTITITVNGYAASFTFGSGSTPQQIASSLATALTGGSSPVIATANGAMITLTATDLGSVSNYSLSTSVSWNSQYFSQASFTATASGAALTGGSDGSLGTSPLVTLYAYDAQNNLTCAVQKGTDTTSFTTCAAAPVSWRPRSFAYDSLSRLISAYNPESGTITYSYDLNSNVASRVGPKPNPNNTGTVTTNYTYDVLNRLTQKSYVGLTTSTVKFAYDGSANLTSCGQNPPSLSASNLVGYRSQMCAGSSGSSWSYDPMGRPIVDSRINAGGGNQTQRSVSYSYYLDGSLKTLTYPSGDVVTYQVGGAQRATQVTDSTNNFATSAKYTPHGALSSMTNGSSLVTSNLYNNRLQPVLLSAGVSGQSPFFSLCYDFHLGISINNPPCSFNAYASGNNGNVFQILNNVDATRSAVFAYDSLNRISRANTVNTTSSNCWGESYTIDTWGNLTNRAAAPGLAGNCTTEPLSAIATTQNQLSGIGMTYDAAGNVTNDGSGNSPTYDAENRIVTDAGVTYSYDGDGARMEKSSGTKYWFGPSGEVLTESALGGTINEEYVYLNGARIARVDKPSGVVHYYFSDHLGSASVITDGSGGSASANYYYPYGGLQSSTGSDPNHYKFTGKERDNESGLDMFGARYYGSSRGRFMMADWADKPTNVPYANFGNPQSLNLYSYVNNNPSTTRDPNGHCLEDACVIEGAVVITAMAVQFLSSPPGQQMLQSAVRGITSVGGSIAGLFHPSNSGQNTSPPPTMPSNVPQGTPGSTTTNAATGTPASTSQQGAVDTSAKQTSGPYAGDNVVQGSGRVNSDLPGGKAAAAEQFGHLTQGQNTQTLPNGHVVAEDGTRLRNNPDGTARIDRPASVTGEQHETIHFNKPDEQNP